MKLKMIDLNSLTDLDEIETNLAFELKSSCDVYGKETNIQASALLLHKLGQVYQKRSLDMFSLIRSATLYNAALVRNPPNKQVVENNLQFLCSDVLFLAGATNKDAQLITQSELVKHEVMLMRQRAAHALEEVKLIPESAKGKELRNTKETKVLLIQELQKQITDDYKQIMINLARYCEEVMGEAPCKFALIGMGSLARCEITPYSDFENVILLDNSLPRDESYEKALNYFRWFSVIFQIVLINLQETIVPSVAIDSLSDWFFDDITPRGISFDGMMPHACKFPLGRQQHTKKKAWQTELIKPIDEMLKYLSSEENLKNGYHLSDILTKTCFVYKDEKLYDQFQNGAFRLTELDYEGFIKDIKKQIIDDLESFATRFSLSNLDPNKPLNVKRVFYRSTTLFISALGRMCNIRASSSFEVVTELCTKKHITKYAKHKLMYALSLACEVRLRWYLKANKQCDNIDSMQNLLKIFGKQGVLSYFQIAYALQCDISKRLNLK